MESEPEITAVPARVLSDVIAWLRAANAKGVIIGGIAASILGRPRLTRDVDVSVLLDEDRWPDFLRSAEPYGFASRRPDALDFAHQTRVLLIRHVPTGVDVDVLLAALPFEADVISRAQFVAVGRLTLPLPTAEDLVIMKAVAHRPQDLLDIEAILDSHTDLNRRHIRRWVREFSSALEMPDLLQDLERLMARRRKRRG
jgi:hypothetical protein